MATVFKIKSVEEPRWEVEFPDGKRRWYDPWKLQQDINAKQDAAKNGQEHYDAVREAFGLPKESELSSVLDESGNVIEWKNFSRNECLAASQALGEFIDSLPVSKKALSLLQNSQGSSPTSPSKS